MSRVLMFKVCYDIRIKRLPLLVCTVIALSYVFAIVFLGLVQIP